MTPMELVISRNIKVWRKRRNLTQQQLAELLAHHGLNWNQSHVSKAEAGHLNAILRIDVLLILASALSVRLDELIASTRDVNGRVMHRDNATIVLGHQGVTEPGNLRAFLRGEALHVFRVRF